ncbi:DeoR family transcriptional regulator [Prauserella marina]|uniref:DNA-binding transcriptional regulator of sugar metabolism, DeoR/GlpR family n=1 Tax=Prauserella marina TaxID=530584 RepID=A0A222VQ59_9PSEU|nr:DeoR/GlpR family DNA-binding transcription regulator [Prauserella marina]ASR36024.1 DeoR family transcriptional regulator [Prauserella marina]PWV84025.1 DeoR family transcriptional regulator [Prauserella marina]SDC32193.1 DNA-binding transcriptional regulator of sugar metabolism, DeoR/GlpR family [Prauserella marina]
MLASQRRARILDEIRRSGAVQVSDLVARLGVSDMTIRRDLGVLAREGQLQKVHGGAVLPGGRSTEEPGFAAKSNRQNAEKEAIATEALSLVEPGMALGLSGGTTTWTFARSLRDVPDITVVTNSVQVADLFSGQPRPDQTVVLTGGIRTPSEALVGPFAVAAIRSVNLDLMFLGVHGMDLRSGFTTPNLVEAETDRAFVEASRRFVVLADHTKYGVLGISTIAGIEAADVLITDSGLAEEYRGPLRERVGELIVAHAAVPEQPVPQPSVESARSAE